MIELTVMGSGYGEGCILAFEDSSGRKRFGLVDGYSSQAPQSDRNPLVRLLTNMTGFAGELEFVIATHPHLDHINGLWQVLQEFRLGVRLIGWWGGPNFKYQVAYFNKLADQAPGHRLRLGSHAFQVAQLLNMVHDLRDRTGPRPELETNVGVAQLYPIGRAGAGSPLRIVAFSPCLPESSKFTDMVTDCVRGRREVTVEHDWDDVNRTSLGLYISWHDVRMLLGGDVETENWEAALPELPVAAYPPVHVVKVAHHGSPNGMKAEMWLPDRRWVRTRPQPTIAVVTPFNLSRSPRPAPRVLRRIREAGCDAYVTGEGHGSPPVGRAMANAFRAAFAGERLPSWITVRLDRAGHAQITSQHRVRRV